MFETVLALLVLIGAGVWYSGRWMGLPARPAGAPALVGGLGYLALFALALLLVFLWR